MNAPPLHDVRALLRLRILREDAAQVALLRRREEEAACRRIVDQRVAQIARVRRARHELMDWLSGRGAAVAPRTGDCAGAHRAALDDQLERAVAELVDERNDLQQAAQHLEAARQTWLRERGRREAVEHLGHNLQRQGLRAREERIDREAEPRQPLET